MTRQDFLIKWGVYALALVPVWFLELFVLNRFPLFGVAPMLLPLAAVCVAVLEDTDGAMTVGLCLIGVGAGALAQYVLRQNLVGCLLCSFAALALIDGVRIAARLLAGRGELAAMLGLAGREILWSLVFVFPVYALFLWVFRRVPKKTVL